MRILVTGAAGFIGSSLCDYLKKQGHFIIGIDDLSYGRYDNLYNENKEFVVNHFAKEDITTDFYFPSDVDIVFHLAAIAPLPDCQSDPKKAYDVNVTGTVNVLEKAREAGVKKVIFASTNAVCENEYNNHYMLSLDSEPDLIYPMTKRAGELLCSSYTKNYSMDVMVVRISNVYGPSQDYLRKHPPLMGYIINCLKDNIQPTFYNTSSKRDYIYIKDLCSFFSHVMVMPSLSLTSYSATSGEVYDVPTIYSTFQEFFDSTIDPIYDNPKCLWDKYPELFRGKYGLRTERVHKEVMKNAIKIRKKWPANWKPQYSLLNGAKEIVDYVKKNIS